MAVVEYCALQGEQGVAGALDPGRQALTLIDDRFASSRVRCPRYKPAVLLQLGADQAESRSHVLVRSAFVHFDVEASLQHLFLVPDLGCDVRAAAEDVSSHVMDIQTTRLQIEPIYLIEDQVHF